MASTIARRCQITGVTLCLVLVWGMGVFAAPGDILYIRGDVVNLRTGPSTQHRIIRQLRAGHELVELQRNGDWVHVEADGSGGKPGWVHASLLSTPSSSGTTTAPSNAAFERFVTAFDQAVTKAQRKTGVTLFTKAEHVGNGTVQITATDTWLAAPAATRQSHLRTIFNLWGAAQGRAVPIAVSVVDKHGKQRMSIKP